MPRFTRGHLANHVGKNAATPPQLQARPLPPDRSAKPDDGNHTFERGGPEKALSPGDVSLKR